MPRQLKFQAGNWLPIAWEEYVGADASHGASFATGWDGGSQITFQIIINWRDAIQAELSLLGSAVFNAGTGNLQRTLPARHPYKPSYFCERILSAAPVRWNDKLFQWQALGVQSSSTGAPLSEYSYFLLTLGFHVPKYRILSDADLLSKYGAMNEWKRFCETVEKPSNQVISRDASLWLWDDAAIPGGKNLTPLTAPIGVGIYSSDLQVRWKRLPRAGLFGQAGESDFFNQNIKNNLNVVHNGVTNLWDLEGNNNTGVLRFLYPEAELIPSPFDPIVQGLGTRDINAYYDVTMHFGIWRPPNGDTTAAANTGPTGNYGWNLAPFPDNLWYLIKTATSGNRIFKMGDLSTVFQLTLLPNP